jgi:hypothetical protein
MIYDSDGESSRVRRAPVSGAPVGMVAPRAFIWSGSENTVHVNNILAKDSGRHRGARWSDCWISHSGPTVAGEH